MYVLALLFQTHRVLRVDDSLFVFFSSRRRHTISSTVRGLGDVYKRQTRMSLSFPVLLSAIPLHSIDRSREPENQKLERGWFTDGGACSNFPLHFFDSPLPRRPTFSIDLTSKPTGTPIELFLIHI